MVISLENGGSGRTLDLDGRETDARGDIGGERVPTFGTPAEAARAGEFGPTQAAQAGRRGGERPRTFDTPAEAAEAGEFAPEFIAVTGGTVARNVWEVDPSGTPGVRAATKDETTSDIDLGGGGGGGTGGGGRGGGGPGFPSIDIPDFPEFPDIPEFQGPDLDLAGPAAILGVFAVVAIGVFALASNIPSAVAEG